MLLVFVCVLIPLHSFTCIATIQALLHYVFAALGGHPYAQLAMVNALIYRHCLLICIQIHNPCL